MSRLNEREIRHRLAALQHTISHEITPTASFRGRKPRLVRRWIIRRTHDNAIIATGSTPLAAYSTFKIVHP